MTTTAPLSELRRDDEGRFGAKSANLGELLGAGIPVPAGFGIATDAFRAFVDQPGVGTAVTARLAAIDVDDVPSLESGCAAIAAHLSAAPMPAAVAEQITHALAGLGAQDVPLAVRSSAIGEDSADATFAGQQATFLWIRGADGVIQAVRDCWASLYSPTAVSYRARIGAGAVAAPAMGVTVQLMVDALVSGVLFTVNPVSGDPSIVAVNASWGLGEAVVSGEVTPDAFLLSKVTRDVVRRTIGAKHVEHVPAPGGVGTHAVEVAPERREIACLADADLVRLVDVARSVERHFGSHQDVEWALARTGAPDDLFVVQARPVTALPERPQPPASQPTSAIGLVMSTFGVKQPTGG